MKLTKVVICAVAAIALFGTTSCSKKTAGTAKKTKIGIA